MVPLAQLRVVGDVRRARHAAFDLHFMQQRSAAATRLRHRHHAGTGCARTACAAVGKSGRHGRSSSTLSYESL